ncbi:tetraspanin-8 [Sarotherodon galilaeus]
MEVSQCSSLVSHNMLPRVCQHHTPAPVTPLLLRQEEAQLALHKLEELLNLQLKSTGLFHLPSLVRNHPPTLKALPLAQLMSLVRVYHQYLRTNQESCPTMRRLLRLGTTSQRQKN